MAEDASTTIQRAVDMLKLMIDGASKGQVVIIDGDGWPILGRDGGYNEALVEPELHDNDDYDLDYPIQMNWNVQVDAQMVSVLWNSRDHLLTILERPLQTSVLLSLTDEEYEQAFSAEIALAKSILATIEDHRDNAF